MYSIRRRSRKHCSIFVIPFHSYGKRHEIRVREIFTYLSYRHRACLALIPSLPHITVYSIKRRSRNFCSIFVILAMSCMSSQAVSCILTCSHVFSGNFISSHAVWYLLKQFHVLSGGFMSSHSVSVFIKQFHVFPSNFMSSQAFHVLSSSSVYSQAISCRMSEREMHIVCKD